MSEATAQDGRPALPAVYQVLGQPVIVRLLEHTDPRLVVGAIRAVLEQHRQALSSGGDPPPDCAVIAGEVLDRLRANMAAREALASAPSTSSLESDPDKSRRGSRYKLRLSAVAAVLRRVPR